MGINENNNSRAINLVDLPLTKKLNSVGEFSSIINSECLAQAVKIWLSNNIGEKIRDGSGGSLARYIGKPMSFEASDEMRRTIISLLSESFTPQLTIVDLQVIPDINNQRWLIYLQGYNTVVNEGVNTYLFIRA
jgi:hypothetical protein